MESKKIGLLTLPLTDNYGGIIQLTALNNYLVEEGYDVYHLNKRYHISYFKQLVRKLLKWNPFYHVFDFNNHAKKYRYIRSINNFIEVELKNTTKEVYSTEQLTKVIEDLGLDTVIVGSDQVWRMEYINENYKDYFLSFINSRKVKKIAYAASLGKEDWSSEDKVTDINKFLSDFHAISVREDSGVRLCDEVFEIKDVKHVLDPTFLSKIEYYEKIIKSDYNKDKTVDLFNYVLDESENNAKIVNDCSNALGLNISTIGLKINSKTLKDINSVKPSMGEWLYHFKNAKFIITDSFHGTVFSIIFNKQFIAIGNKNRGLTRFQSLLSSLGLMDRLIIDDIEDIKNILEINIDYNVINQRLDKLKLNSISFLKDSLR